jgi:uncharacterized membrane protein YagU involved in acid resistance
MVMASAHSRRSVRGSNIRVILVGGLAAGLIDILYACIVHSFAGLAPTVILQSVASGLLGRAAYHGGAATAAFGLLLHMLMTVAMAAIFVAAARRFPALAERPLRSGAAYGIAIYVIMNHVVLPLSAFPGSGRPPSLPMLIGGLFIHAFGVGVPIALATRRFARRA